MLTPQDRIVAARLRQALLRAEFTADGVLGLVGAQAYSALSREEFVPARLGLRGVSSVLADLVRLFVLDEVLDIDALAEQFPLDDVRSLGLVEGSERIHAVVDVRPYGEPDTDWYVVSDHSAGRGAISKVEVDSDHVLGVGGASLTLARITPRIAVKRALDIGTGCGVQALHLNRHCGEVVATDNNPRALRCADLSAVLSGFDWDTRVGSFLEPVNGETFDLIVSNPPFVISPGHRYTYRDAGFEADHLGRDLVAALPSHLTEHGVAVLLANWLHVEGEDWRERVTTWVTDIGCSAWIAQREVQDPSEYVGLWLRDAGNAGSDQDRRYEDWLQTLESWGTQSIGFGWIVLTKSDRPWVHVEDVSEAHRLPNGDEVMAVLGALDDLERTNAFALLESRLAVAAGVVVRSQERYVENGEWAAGPAMLSRPDGWRQDQFLDAVTRELVAHCDGQATVRQLLDSAAAELAIDEDEVLAIGLIRLRELIAQGFLILANDS